MSCNTERLSSHLFLFSPHKQVHLTQFTCSLKKSSCQRDPGAFKISSDHGSPPQMDVYPLSSCEQGSLQQSLSHTRTSFSSSVALPPSCLPVPDMNAGGLASEQTCHELIGSMWTWGLCPGLCRWRSLHCCPFRGGNESVCGPPPTELHSAPAGSVPGNIWLKPSQFRPPNDRRPIICCSPITLSMVPRKG